MHDEQQEQAPVGMEETQGFQPNNEETKKPDHRTLWIVGGVVFVFVLIVGIGVFAVNKFLGTSKSNESVAEQHDTLTAKEDVLSNSKNLMDNGKFDQAINILENYIQNNEISDTDIKTRLALSWAAKTQSEYGTEVPQEAFNSIDQVIKENPASSEAYRIKGYLEEVAFNFDEAIRNYQKAIELNPNNFAAYQGLGHCYSYLGEKEETKEVLEKAYELKPGSAIITLTLANHVYLKERNLEKAEELAKETINNTENKRLKAEGYTVLGNVYYLKNDKPKSNFYYDKSMEVDETYAVAYIEKASNLIELFDFDSVKSDGDNLITEAIELLNEAQRLNPKNIKARYLQAHVMNILDMLDSAVNALRLAISVAENEKDVVVWGNQSNIKYKAFLYYELASVYSKKNMTEEAFKNLKWALEVYPKLKERLSIKSESELYFINIKDEQEFKNLIK